MKANDHQVGGSHYKTDFEHWDMAIAVGMGAEYLSCTATKYIARWRKKDGLKDLQKALHYIDKLREAVSAGLLSTPNCIENDFNYSRAFSEIARFSLVNGLSEREQMAVAELTLWKRDSDLAVARDMVMMLIEEAESPPVPASDSNKHADRATEEPK